MGVSQVLIGDRIKHRPDGSQVLTGNRIKPLIDNGMYGIIKRICNDGYLVEWYYDNGRFSDRRIQNYNSVVKHHVLDKAYYRNLKLKELLHG